MTDVSEWLDISWEGLACEHQWYWLKSRCLISSSYNCKGTEDATLSPLYPWMDATRILISDTVAASRRKATAHFHLLFIVLIVFILKMRLYGRTTNIFFFFFCLHFLAKTKKRKNLKKKNKQTKNRMITWQCVYFCVLFVKKFKIQIRELWIPCI